MVLDETKFYVYTHTRPDTGKVFYVGKGKNKRAFWRTNRSLHWKRIVSKNNGIYQIDIVKYFEKESDALKYESELIGQIGLDNLTNIQAKGIESSGYKHSEKSRLNMRLAAIGRIIKPETREKLRAHNTGKKAPERKPEFRKFLSESRKGRGNPMFGKKVTEEAKQKQRDKISGSNNYLSKLVFNLETGIYYECLTEAALSCNIKKATLWASITRNKIRNKKFIYA